MSDPIPPLLTLPGAQLGDTKIDAAGRDQHTTTNTTHQGADATEVLLFLKEYLFKADQQRETVLKDVRGELGLLSDSLRGLRNQVNDLATDADKDKEDAASRLLAELRERRHQRRVQNWWLGTITAAVAVMAIGWLYLLWRLWPVLATVATMAQLAH